MKNSHGFSALEALVGVAIIVFVSTTAVYIANQVVQLKLRLDYRTQAAAIKLRISDLVNDGPSWAATLQKNTAELRCLIAHTDCAGAGARFAIYDSFNKLWTDSAPNSKMGFNLNGQVCNSFSPTVGQGNSNCPFQMSVSWSPVCPPAPALCTNPQIRVTGTLLLNAGPQTYIGSINMTPFSFSVIRPGVSLLQACLSMNGSFDSATARCTLPLVGDCAYGIILGINPTTHSKVCGFPWAGRCPAGLVLSGTDNAGNPICSAGSCIAPVAPAPPPPVAMFCSRPTILPPPSSYAAPILDEVACAQTCATRGSPGCQHIIAAGFLESCFCL